MNFPKKKLRKIIENRLFQAVIAALLGALGITATQVELGEFERTSPPYRWVLSDPEIDS